MNKIEADQLIVVLDCMLYSLCQACDSWINVLINVEDEYAHRNQLYTIIDTMYKLMDASGLKPEHYHAMLHECRWYDDEAWKVYCSTAKYPRKW